MSTSANPRDVGVDQHGSGPFPSGSTSSPWADPTIPSPPAVAAPPANLRTGSPLFGTWLMAASGAVALLAFLTLPVVVLPLVGAFTVPQLGSLLAGVGADGLLFVTWIVPVAALGLIAAGGVASQSTAGSALAAAAIALALATFAFWIYLVGGTVLGQALSTIPGSGLFGMTASSTLSAGYWIVLLAMAAGMGGAVVQLEACSRIRRRKGR